MKRRHGPIHGDRSEAVAQPRSGDWSALHPDAMPRGGSHRPAAAREALPRGPCGRRLGCVLVTGKLFLKKQRNPTQVTPGCLPPFTEQATGAEGGCGWQGWRPTACEAAERRGLCPSRGHFVVCKLDPSAASGKKGRPPVPGSPEPPGPQPQPLGAGWCGGALRSGAPAEDGRCLVSLQKLGGREACFLFSVLCVCTAEVEIH